MKVLLIDNHDSFTYNLVQMVEQILGKENVWVAKNDDIELSEIQKFDKIILSPGPGVPKEAGKLLEIIKLYAPKKPILGVCLGLQAIVEAFGGSLIQLDQPCHGIGSALKIIDKSGLLFRGITIGTIVGRYHSWAANKLNLPEELEITATDESGIIMAIRHKKWQIHAVQFHPESILTPEGKKILANFIDEK